MSHFVWNARHGVEVQDRQNELPAVRALAEAARVLEPGGVLVCCHPDYESFVLEVPSAPAHLVALAKRTRIDLNYLNSAVPRQVPRLLLDLGLRDVATEAFTLVVDDPDEPSLSVPTWLRDWRDRGRITLTDDELSAWDHAVARARDEGGYLASVTYLLTHAIKG